jgi:cytochrome c
MPLRQHRRLPAAATFAKLAADQRNLRGIMIFRIPLPALAALLVLSAPALAQDAAKGESEFKKCKACHAIVAPDGTAIQKGGKTGPNLYGVVGRTVASTDFAYGDSLKSVGAAGTTWDEAALAAYVADPTAWLKEATGDAGAKSKMSFKLAKGGADVAAYLASVAPASE